MEHIIEVTDLSKHYRGVNAVDGVSFTVEKDGIYGLLGRNGAGKSTLMQLLAGQVFKTSGQIRIMGQDPVENAEVMSNIAFIKESERYPENIIPKASDVLSSAALICQNWDAEFADKLVSDFRVPLKRQMRKLSRGQVSAVGVIVGLASRAPITLFDEPYLGMDPVARKMFYDHLLADYSQHPRTILLSTHLIDEAADLMEHVLVMDQGRFILNAKTDDLRGTAMSIEGLTRTVRDFASNLEVLNTQVIGGFSRTVVSALDSAQRAAATELGLTLKPLSLQELIISKTNLTQELEMETTK
jgi:ABC-2 type transport system ATP-binding protein